MFHILKNNIILINDTYNASLASVEDLISASIALFLVKSCISTATSEKIGLFSNILLSSLVNFSTKG